MRYIHQAPSPIDWMVGNHLGSDVNNLRRQPETKMHCIKGFHSIILTIQAAIPKISNTWSLFLSGIGLVAHHLSARLCSANASNLSSPTPITPRLLGIPSSVKMTSKQSPRSAVLSCKPLFCSTDFTSASAHKIFSTPFCLSSLTFLLYLQTAGSKIQLVSPWPTPNGPN